MRTIRASIVAAASAALAVSALSACDDKNGSGGAIAVQASDSHCEVARTNTDAGKVSFEVQNGGSKVTEFYIYASGDRIMGEVENIGPGLKRKLIVELPAGKYQTACKPGMKGDGIRGAFTVSGSSANHESTDKKLANATTSYQRYITTQATALEEQTQTFVDAVKKQDIDKAKELYPVARTYYERIEPVAEIFGKRDPAIDGREADLEQGQQFTGFHRIEKALWQENDLSQMGPIADKLLADVKGVVTKSKDTKLNPLQLANGSKELLDEVATGKITGEEDTFSHTDLWDFNANVEGSKAAINSLRPVLQERNPDLLKQIDDKFAAVDAALAKHQRGDGYQLYNELSPGEVKELSSTVDAVAEPVGKVAEVVARDNKKK